jgi:large subunit ribosomal protein L15
MSELNTLRPPKGATKTDKRVGRGYGSGNRKTAGKGHKGQKARSGHDVRRNFEGGQMPLNRRLPKRGFKNVLAGTVAVVNVGQLNVFDEGAVVDRDALKRAGLLKGVADSVKCLGFGELEKRLTVKLDGFSKSAAEKIEARSGKAEVIRGE